MNNLSRYLIVLGLAFLGGIVQEASDPGAHAVSDYVRHGLIGLGPALIALNMTLNKQDPNAGLITSANKQDPPKQ